MIRQSVVDALKGAEFFQGTGAYVLVDGQYGSTGKGLAADLLEQYDAPMGAVDLVTTNAAPNSGHTAVLDDGATVFTQQLPVFAACRGIRLKKSDDYVRPVSVYLNGGSVIDPVYLEKEIREYMSEYSDVHDHLHVHSAAAIITDRVKSEFSSEYMDKIASTGKGTGQAMAAKILRMPYVAEDYYTKLTQMGATVKRHVTPPEAVTLVETAQGFSLGPNSGFYPYVTSRECTVGQALSDAGIHPDHYKACLMVVRTFPIRVGNTDKGNSGGWYPDQEELTWEDVGQTPELTSVTKRVRRVATFSVDQFREALLVNRPSVVLLNFAQYLPPEELDGLCMRMFKVAQQTRVRVTLLLGFGPKAQDVMTYSDFVSGQAEVYYPSKA